MVKNKGGNMMLPKAKFLKICRKYITRSYLWILLYIVTIQIGSLMSEIKILNVFKETYKAINAVEGDVVNLDEFNFPEGIYIGVMNNDSKN